MQEKIKISLLEILIHSPFASTAMLTQCFARTRLESELLLYVGWNVELPTSDDEKSAVV